MFRDLVPDVSTLSQLIFDQCDYNLIQVDVFQRLLSLVQTVEDCIIADGPHFQNLF